MKKKATCVSLFLAFHEYCGHLKNEINNLEDTPRQFYDTEFTFSISIRKRAGMAALPKTVWTGSGDPRL